MFQSHHLLDLKPKRGYLQTRQKLKKEKEEGEKMCKTESRITRTKVKQKIPGSETILNGLIDGLCGGLFVVIFSSIMEILPLISKSFILAPQQKFLIYVTVCAALGWAIPILAPVEEKLTKKVMVMKGVIGGAIVGLMLSLLPFTGSVAKALIWAASYSGAYTISSLLHNKKQ
jgi:hypothetical protein